MNLKRTKITILAVVMSLGSLALAPAAGAHPGHPGHNTQDADGLVVVQISDVNLTVPINAAVAIAANVCNVDVDVTAAVLATIDDVDGGTLTGDCESNSEAFSDQVLTITNN